MQTVATCDLHLMMWSLHGIYVWICAYILVRVLLFWVSVDCEHWALSAHSSIDPNKQCLEIATTSPLSTHHSYYSFSTQDDVRCISEQPHLSDAAKLSTKFRTRWSMDLSNVYATRAQLLWSFFICAAHAISQTLALFRRAGVANAEGFKTTTIMHLDASPLTTYTGRSLSHATLLEKTYSTRYAWKGITLTAQPKSQRWSWSILAS